MEKNVQRVCSQRCPRVNCPACTGFAPDDAPPVAHVEAVIASGQPVCSCCRALVNDPSLAVDIPADMQLAAA